MSRYAHFDEMTWPLPDEDLQWRLRYAPESVTDADRRYLASLASAYAALIYATQEKRNKVCRRLRDAENAHD